MNDDGIGSLFFWMLAIIILSNVGTCEGGQKMGKLEGMCETRAEFALTGQDTLNVLRKYPKCAEFLTNERTN